MVDPSGGDGVGQGHTQIEVVDDGLNDLGDDRRPPGCPQGQDGPAVGDSDVANAYTESGWIHIFGLGYDWAVPELSNQVLNLSANLVYNDGTGAVDVAHDWSHIVFGISTGFTITNNLTFTPAFYFQKSMEDTVNTSDEYWTTLSLSYTF